MQSQSSILVDLAIETSVRGEGEVHVGVFHTLKKTNNNLEFSQAQKIHFGLT